MPANNATRQILVLGHERMALNAARSLHHAGFQVLGLDYANQPGNPLRWLCHEVFCIGPQRTVLDNASECPEEIARIFSLADALGFDTVLPADADYACSAGLTRAAMEAGLKMLGPSDTTLSLINNRVEFHRLANRLGLPVVAGGGEAYEDIETACSAGRMLRFPIWVRPAKVSLGQGKQITEAGELTREVSRALARYSHIVLEEWSEHARITIEIPVFADCDGMIRTGSAITASRPIRGQVDFFESPPFQLDATMDIAIQTAAESLVRTLEMVGYARVQFSVPEAQDSFQLIGLQPGLSPTDELIRLCGDIDIAPTMVALADGQPVPKTLRGKGIQDHAIMLGLIYLDDHAQQGGTNSSEWVARCRPRDRTAVRSVIDTDLFPNQAIPSARRESVIGLSV